MAVAVTTMTSLDQEGRILRVCPCNNEENGDKFILDPVQLIDLVNEELNNKKGDIPAAAVLSHYKTANVLLTKDTAETSTEQRKEVESIKAKKVWSRWSKWGECSVSCGSGTISRCRICVEGRCAPGEREEQRRPCSRAPCHALAIPDEDPHYLEEN